MYNSEKTARRQNKWVSLMICWLIILGGSCIHTTIAYERDIAAT